MVKINQLKPAKLFGPGYFIKEQMELREWTQADIAEILGVTLKHVNKILNDKQPITLDMARVLGEVFDTDAKYWVNLDTSYRLWLDQEKSDKEKDADIKAMIFERMPIKDMVSKGWIPAFKSTKELEESVLEFWEWDTLGFKEIDDLIKSDSCLTRKSEAFSQFNEYYKITWYKMAQKVAEPLKDIKYDLKGLRDLYNQIHEFTNRENGISEFLEALRNVGVIFFVLPHLQKTYLDGAAFISGKNPVVIYTGRYKRIDNFWFTIAHEIAHVLKHLNKAGQFILDDLKESLDSLTRIEEEANQLASEKLKHDEIVEYLKPYLNYLTTTKVEECASDLKVHPSIIIGKLAREGKISYRHIHLYNDNVLELIPKDFMWNKKQFI